MPTKKKPKTRKSAPTIWQHLKENWRLYMIVSVIVGSLAGSSHLYHNALAAQKAVASWPSAEAEILKSQVTQYPAPPPSAHAITAVLEISYQLDGKPVNTRYSKTWTTSQDIDFSDTLAEGKSIKIKHSPIDPTSISLNPLGP